MAFHSSIRRPYRAAFGAACVFGMLLCGLSGASIASAGAIKLDTRLGRDVLTAGETQHVYVRVLLEGIAVESTRRTPVNIALVLDRSGSMRGDKLAQAKKAAGMALARLDRHDVMAIVAYDDIVQSLLPATRLNDREGARARVAAMEAGGRTALYAGVEQGLREIAKFRAPDRVNRLILLSDGLANVGPSTPAELGRLGRRAAGACEDGRQRGRIGDQPGGLGG